MDQSSDFKLQGVRKIWNRIITKVHSKEVTVKLDLDWAKRYIRNISKAEQNNSLSESFGKLCKDSNF